VRAIAERRGGRYFAESRLGVVADAAGGLRSDPAVMSTGTRQRRLARTADPERYEVCELSGTASLRVVATAGTGAAARLAVRTLYDEGEAKRGALVIRDAITGRQLPV
jgi:hypothetical protein